MPILTDGPMMEPQNKGIDEYHAGRGEALAAAASQAFADNPASQISGLYQMDRAKGEEIDFGEVATGMPTPGMAEEKAAALAAPRIDIIDANDRVKKAGLASVLKLPDQPDIHPAQLDIMMSRARARREREATMERGPQGFVQSALSTGTSFAVGAIDPLNVASAFIPVMGELRYAKLLAGAGESFAGRAAVRAGVGATEGMVGQAALEPLDWFSHTQDGRDFGMSDVLHNILFGAVLGGALHAGGGAISDIYRARKERPMYPYDLGEPLESHTPWEDLRARQQPPPIPRDILGEFPGVHVRGAHLAEEGIPAQSLEEHFNEAARAIEPHDPAAHEPIFPESPNDAHVTPAALTLEHRANVPNVPSAAVQTIDDLPQRAKEDAARAGIANLIEGEPLRVGEMLEAAAQTDPRIAESFVAWHGSPHDFEAFDNSKIGTGEGAQAFAYGHYLAEAQAVAEGYQRNLAERDQLIADLVAKSGGNWAKAAADFEADIAARRDLAAKVGGVYEATAAEKTILSQLRSGGFGQLYKVRIKPDRDRFLKWETDLTDQPAGRMILEKMDPALKEQLEEELARHDQPELDQLTGGMLHRLLERYASEGELPGVKGDGGHPKREASEYLASLDVPGVVFLDQKSRQRGALGDLDAKPVDDSATRNFVVFNDKDIEITHKNGEPVNREKFLEERAAERETAVKPKAARGRAAADPRTWSLYEFLAHEGGLKPDAELEAIFGNRKGPFVPGFGALVRPNGRSLDDALRLAKDHGYMFDAADITGAEGRLTPRDLLDHLAEENSGRKQYRLDQSLDPKADHEREIHEIISALHHEIEASTGQKGIHVDPMLENRVVEIVRREGERDVLAAYERAIMEDAERYEGLSRERQNHPETAAIPGWDRPEPGAASRAGEADQGQRGQAGLSGEGARGEDGGQPRGVGAGDRSPVQTQLARDDAWRRLSHADPEFDDPVVIAASNSASETKPPPSKLDERVTAAQKAEAYAKQMYDMFADRLPEGDRHRLDDLIKTIDSDHEAHEVAISRGGACLFGARD